MPPNPGEKDRAPIFVVHLCRPGLLGFLARVYHRLLECNPDHCDHAGTPWYIERTAVVTVLENGRIAIAGERTDIPEELRREEINLYQPDGIEKFVLALVHQL